MGSPHEALISSALAAVTHSSLPEQASEIIIVCESGRGR